VRPRERLVARGAQSLSDDELITLVIGSGTGKRSALVLANELLRAIGGLRSLGQADAAPAVSERPPRRGSPRPASSAGASSSRARTASAVTRRSSPRPLSGRTSRTSSASSWSSACSRKQRLIAVAPTYWGSVSGTPVRIAELFTEAIRRQAPGVLLAHNHPSGDPTPSADDIRTTRDAAAAGRLLGIDVADHLVFGAGRWVSLRRIGAFS